MRALLVIVALVLLLLAAFAAFAPATLVQRELTHVAGDRLQLVATEGTIWSGRGELAIAGSDVRLPVAWRIDVPASLAHAELRGSLTTDSSGGPGARFELGRDRVHIEQLDLTLPAVDIVRAANATLPLAVGGNVRLRVARFDSDRTTATVDAVADWDQADLAAAGSDLRLALGNVHVVASGAGAEIPGILQNDGGDVQLSGTMRWPVRGNPGIDLTVAPRPEMNPDRAASLNALLRLVGRPSAGGYRLSWAGSR